jgi:hypothetical protein
MPTSSNRTPHDYTLKVILEAERGITALNISEAVVHIDLFEHLEKPFMTGTLTLTDNIGLVNAVAFRGTEKIILSAAFPDGSGKTFTKTFRIQGINTSHKSNDFADTFVFHLVEDIFYKNKLTLLSRVFTGKPNEIIQKVLRQSELERELDVTTPPIQDRIQYLAPNVNPFQITNLMRTASTTREGYPYFLYSVLNNEEKLFFRNLQELFTEEPITRFDKAFLYSSVATRQSDTQNLDDAARVIEKYSHSNSDNIMEIASNGFLKADLESVNINQYVTRASKLNMIETLKEMESILPDFQTQFISDEEFLLDFIQKDPRVFTLMTASNIYSSGLKSLSDITTFPNGKGFFTQMALRHMFRLNAIDVELPGYLFWNTDNEPNTIGKNINLKFFNSDINIMTTRGSTDNILDKKKSGQYMIYSMKHSFGISKYSVSATCVKLSTLNPEI